MSQQNFKADLQLHPHAQVSGFLFLFLRDLRQHDSRKVWVCEISEMTLVVSLRDRYCHGHVSSPDVRTNREASCSVYNAGLTVP